MAYYSRIDGILRIEYVKAYTLDLSGETGIYDIRIFDCDVKRIILPFCSDIKYLSIEESKGIDTLELSRLPNLEEFSCNHTGLQYLDFSKNKKLRIFSGVFSKIKTLDFSKNLKLEVIDMCLSKHLEKIIIKNGKLKKQGLHLPGNDVLVKYV